MRGISTSDEKSIWTTSEKAELLKQQAHRFPDEDKINARKLTVETVRGASNSRHEENSIALEGERDDYYDQQVGKYLVSGSLIQWPIYVSKRWVTQLPFKTRVRATSTTLMCDAQVKNQGNRPRMVNPYPRNSMSPHHSPRLFATC